MYSKRNLFCLLAVVICLFLTACKKDNFCRLTQEDKSFLMFDDNMAHYIENKTTEVDYVIHSKIVDSWNETSEYTVDGGNEIGSSHMGIIDKKFYIIISTTACSPIVRIACDCQNPWSRFSFEKDSTLSEAYTINNKSYDHCISFSDTLGIKKLIYSKGHGVISLELEDGFITERLK